MNDTTPNLTDRTAAHHTEPAAEPLNPTLVAIGGLILGLLLLIVAFANLNRMPGWADDYGAILVYLAFFLYMSLAGRLTWWGIDTLRDQAKRDRGRR
ncbi:hypothetical protein IU501_36015 [Nocardia otitidiscaviarum]|uniref:hypothetical protein n=1 Tax=Nocardia otitidiscaviarum TaxID=1823 RepID=UPI0006948143|nr:hypothetical protein [Nocardia otitidiscaviarum]MBF6138378.1 hypothetical protein [Nocardia otitidiscaviarum]MBF6489225.1 hypothetical protein [Nocardia otitidiscaviarum]